MKNHRLRKDKNCLNCGTIVPERFCSHCGQENTEPRESFGHLIGHFFEDVTHYDSRFLTTINDLIFKPGFLTKEYIAGKRVSYLNPVRMYIFISAVFFLVMLSQNKEQNNTNAVTIHGKEANVFRQHLADSLREAIKTNGKLSLKDSIRNELYSAIAARLDTPLKTKILKDESVGAFINNYGVVTLKLKQNKYKNINEYETEQHALPENVKDNALSRYITKKVIRMVSRENHNGELIITQNIAHDIPKIMFVFLPMFALFVSLFYSRIIGFFYKGKEYLYSQHIIFSLHFHSFVFIVLFFVGLISLVVPMDKVWMVMLIATLLLIFIYLVAALHGTYEQAIWLSAIKAIAISTLYIITIIIGLLLIFAAIFIFA